MGALEMPKWAKAIKRVYPYPGGAVPFPNALENATWPTAVDCTSLKFGKYTA